MMLYHLENVDTLRSSINNIEVFSYYLFGIISREYNRSVDHHILFVKI